MASGQFYSWCQAPGGPAPAVCGLCFSGLDRRSSSLPGSGVVSRSVASRPRGPSGPGGPSLRGSGSGPWVTHRGHVHQSTGGRVGGQGLTGAWVGLPLLLEPPGPIIFSLGDLGKDTPPLCQFPFVKVGLKSPPFGAGVGAGAFQARVRGG